MKTTIKELLEAPCMFCKYKGEGYWQANTHEKDCPFHKIRGEIDRIKYFPIVVKKLNILREFYNKYSKYVKKLESEA